MLVSYPFSISGFVSDDPQRSVTKNDTARTNTNLGVILAPIISRMIKPQFFGWGSLLEIGCGDGALLDLLAPHFAESTGIDLDLTSARRRRFFRAKPIKYVQSNFESHRFEQEQRFDVIVTAFAAHHFHLEKTLPKMRNLLSPGGQIILIDLHAEHRSGIMAYIGDQLIFSNNACWACTSSTDLRLTVMQTLKLFWARLRFFLDPIGLLHTLADLRRGRPQSLGQWFRALDAALPAGEWGRLNGSIFTYQWMAPSQSDIDI